MDIETYLRKRSVQMKDFAEELHISERALRYYMRGKRLPPLDVAKRMTILSRGDITIDHLLITYYRENPEECFF